MVYDKLIAFKEAYKFILDSKNESLLIVNSINNADNLEILYGIIDFYKDFKVYSPKIHVNIYDSKYHRTCFDELADSVISEDLKSSLGINNGKYKDDMAQLLDILNTKLTYSKHELSSTREYKYAHISFFKNNAEVECTDVDPTQQLSGVLSNGLIVGEASVSNNNIFYTTFGLKNIDIENYIHLNIANKINRLFKSYIQPNVQYSPHNSIALSVSGLFKTELDKVYDNSIWTCIIDPKVTLDFFSSSKDIVLIHYSDSYTNSTNYDAITVTKQTDLYRAVLEVNHNEGYIEEFNAFNGEWLLKMITDNHNERKAKKGIIGAYKFVSCLLSQSSIIWIPISVAEMIRVSGNIGLSMSDSDFARILHMGTTKGAMSDDILFVGFKDNNLYLLPVEVKTGKRASHNYGIQQAQNLKEFLEKGLLGRSGLAGNIYRGLFIRQILMQIEKYKLYSLYNENYFNALIERREWWLQGNYNLGKLENYFETILYSNVEDSNLTEPEFTPQDKNLKIEVPIGFLDFFISKPLQMLTNDLTNTIFKYIDKQYILDNWDSFLSVQNEPKVQLKTLESFISFVEPVEPVEPVNTEPLRIHFGENPWTHEQYFWEPTNTSKFMNTNTGIIGTMGTGKTQFTKSVITQLIQKQNNNVNSAPIGLLIFDYKSDYIDNQFLEINSVKRYQLHRLPYNPLSLFGNTPMLPVHTARGFSDTMAKAYGLGVAQQAILRKLILDAYDRAGIKRSNPSTWGLPAPTIKDVWNLYIKTEPTIDSLYAALESLNELEIFESEGRQCSSLYELLNGVLVIELAGYPIQIQNLVVALLVPIFPRHTIYFFT